MGEELQGRIPMICFLCGFESDNEFDFCILSKKPICFECVVKFKEESFQKLIEKRKRELDKERRKGLSDPRTWQ